VKELRVNIFTHTRELPQLPGKSFFQSTELMAIYEKTPRMRPFMAVAEDNSGNAVAHLLAVVRYRHTWLPPFFYTTCAIIGGGDYDESLNNSPELNSTRGKVFGLMLNTITKAMQTKVLFIEVSCLPTKMYAYEEFRAIGYFPVHWMSIHNSIHSRTPEERVSERAMRHITHAKRRGAITTKATTDADINDVIKLLHRHNITKPKRYMPDANFFKLLLKSERAEALVTRARGRVIGCSVTVCSEGDDYLWYAAFRRKSFALYHPDYATIWEVLKSAQQNGKAHVRFMDVGLPFRKNPFREFILRFGGKPTATYRWFRCSWRWLNATLSWIYRN